MNNQIAKKSFRVFPYGFWIVNGDLSVDQETISAKVSNKRPFEMAELGSLTGVTLARDDSEGAIPSARHEGRMRSDMEQGYAITSLERPSMPRRGPAYSLQKRFLDVAGSFGLLIFLAPTLLLIALAIKLDSRGPVLFVQRRTGLNGVPFRVYKFRSMSVADDGDVVKQATRNDSRVTRVGRFLRRSSLDELPQLLNVLKGDMSLVGPRPHALAHDEYYGSNIADYHKRFRARPGITGLSQVKGFRGETETVADMEQRIRFDNLYIESWSILKDIWILVSTAVIVPLQRTAY